MSIVKFDVDVYLTQTKVITIVLSFSSAILNKPLNILYNVVVELYEWVDWGSWVKRGWLRVKILESSSTNRKYSGPLIMISTFDFFSFSLPNIDTEWHCLGCQQLRGDSVGPGPLSYYTIISLQSNYSSHFWF